MSGGSNLENARSLVKFLGSADAKKRFVAAGIE